MQSVTIGDTDVLLIAHADGRYTRRLGPHTQHLADDDALVVVHGNGSLDVILPIAHVDTRTHRVARLGDPAAIDVAVTAELLLSHRYEKAAKFLRSADAKTAEFLRGVTSA